MVLTLWEHIGGMYLEFSYRVYSHWLCLFFIVG